ncbi:MAG: hypothetical protein MI861_07135, partial [Pirellulales bacterium]|nr:hypothetical protein [Pirellulales bacterium]
VACRRVGAAGFKALTAGTLRAASRLTSGKLHRGAIPWLLVADAAQWATEAGGHHLGLRNPQRRRRAARAIGGATALSLGSMGGPVGMLVAGGVWITGEMAGEVSRKTYAHVEQKRHHRDCC